MVRAPDRPGAPRTSTTGPLSNITWVWNGTTWVQQHPARSPAGRGYGAMTYDNQIKQVVMFGGTTGSRDPAGVWAWNGTNWHRP